MGIKPSYIKSLSQELIVKHGNRFSGDFDENKLAVSEVSVIDSKRVRNRVAGYITRKVNRRKEI
ncbi:30S ribosomal protein S17e [Methanogenium sp. S4BF]|uniref:30S ribosomal protein S17e n=1 Tax=Methanogenium sp. S4BF TaxID=1789226 RepID=UPI0024161463|nr:30S ribosomal protein S17e [Methanogenium sp. S4BF]WFN35040.1 30S ribosomal protein S17e [Methanogenium sp. S4BF]